MIEVDSKTYGAIFGLLGVVLVAGWVAYALLAPESRTIFAAMVIANMVLGGGAGVLVRKRKRSA